MDYTFEVYKSLTIALKGAGYSFQTFSGFLESASEKSIILRHDVESKIQNAVKMAEICNDLQVSATFFIRIFDNRPFPEAEIKKIAELGHEIGYHYDDLSECNGDYEKAIQRFQDNLERLRSIAPVKTIVAEGAPLSRYNNKDLWASPPSGAEAMAKELVTDHESLITPHDSRLTIPASDHTSNNSTTTPPHYRDFNIIGEPYFDVDFGKVFYLTDTGRRWDGYKVSVRDKIPEHQERWEKEGLVFHTTRDIIDFFQNGRSLGRAATKQGSSHRVERLLSGVEAPDQIMFTFHPQRWNPFGFSWVKELVLQNLKNVVKKIIVKRDSRER